MNDEPTVGGFTPEELRLLVKHPTVLDIAADINDAKDAEIGAMRDDSSEMSTDWEWNARRAAQLRAERDRIIAEDPDLWISCIDGQVNDFMQGIGATEDHVAIKNALLSINLSPETANHVMQLLVGKEWRCTWVPASYPPSIIEGTGESREVIFIAENGVPTSGTYCKAQDYWIDHTRTSRRAIFWTEFPDLKMQIDTPQPKD